MIMGSFLDGFLDVRLYVNLATTLVQTKEAY